MQGGEGHSGALAGAGEGCELHIQGAQSEHALKSVKSLFIKCNQGN